MLILDKIWRIFIEGKYGSVHDIIGPRPMSHDQKQKNAFLLKDLRVQCTFFSTISCTIPFLQPFWRNLSMHFGLRRKINKLGWKMCFFGYSFGYIFWLLIFFFAKSMLIFREKQMFFRIILKYSSYVYFSTRTVHFSWHQKWYSR